jgi:hypothetical protein
MADLPIDKLRALRHRVLAATPRKAPDAKLAAYLAKVERSAYRITGEEVQELVAAGHAEHEIFEETVGAALGTAIAQMEAGLAALEGVK